MTWIDNDYETEMSLERKQIEEELEMMMKEDCVPDWKFPDDED